MSKCLACEWGCRHWHHTIDNGLKEVDGLIDLSGRFSRGYYYCEVYQANMNYKQMKIADKLTYGNQ